MSWRAPSWRERSSSPPPLALARPRRSRRAVSNDELGADDLVSGLTAGARLGPLDGRPQCGGGKAALGRHVLADRGQRWVGMASNGTVVEPDDGEVLGDGDA